MVVVGSPQTLSGYRTESLGFLTDALVTFGLRLACIFSAGLSYDVPTILRLPTISVASTIL